MNSNYRAVLFDMDGLMLDTERIYFRAIQDAAARLGYKASDELILSFVGLSVEQSERRIREAAGDSFSIDEFRALWPRLWSEYAGENGIPLKEGLMPVLDWLAENDVPRAVVTSTYASDAEQSLLGAGIDGYFTTVVSGDQVERTKPAPDIYLLGAKRLGVAPEACVALEDSNAGVLSASTAQMRVIMVPDLLQPSEVAQQAAHCVLPSLVDALPLLQEWVKS